LAHLPPRGRLGLGPVLPVVLPARLRDPRLSLGACIPGLARLRPRAALGRDAPLRAAVLRRGGVRLPVSEPDPLIRNLREQISDTDRAIVDAVNKRLKLVAQIKRYKESRGMDFVDPEREEWMLK